MTASDPLRPTRWAAPIGLAAVLVILAGLARSIWGINPDTSWLLDVAERTLNGAVPYRDILEVNPPASFLIYSPAVWLARMSGIEPETATNLLVSGGAVLSLGLSGGILLRAALIGAQAAASLLCWGLFVLLVLPLASFAQREHVAVIAILPAVACAAARLAGARPGLLESVGAGIGAGLAVSVKPVFGLALLGPWLLLIVLHRWPAAQRAAEVWVAAGLFAIYAVGVMICCPDYGARILPLATSIYVPARLAIVPLLLTPGLWICGALLSAVWKAGPADHPVGVASALAALGFAAGVLIQGKGYTYHTYPAVALAVLAAGAAGLAGRPDRPRGAKRSGLPVCGAVGAAAALVVFAEPGEVTDRTQLRAEMDRIAPHPRLLTISGDAELGQVLARRVGGTWVGSAPIPWVTCFASVITPTPERDPRFAEAIRMERIRYAQDIDRGRPDMILIDGEGWRSWAEHGAELSRALQDYRLVARVGATTLWSPARMARS